MPLPSDDLAQLDVAAIRRAFANAAATYDETAVLQHEVRARLLERLRLINNEPATIVDLGAGGAQASRALQERFPRAQVIALDSCLPMLQQAHRQQSPLRKFDRVCGSAFALPLRSNSVDWCISNLLLPWCDPPDAVLGEVHRVLKPDRPFSFTSFGPDTLGELRTAWAAVDRGPHVHRFADIHDLGDALIRAGFAEPVLDAERIVLTYTELEQFFRELKDTGGVTAARGRVRHLGSRRLLRAVAMAYESFRVQSRLPATFEIVYGQAWRPQGRHRPSTNGETRIALDQIGGRRRQIY